MKPAATSRPRTASTWAANRVPATPTIPSAALAARLTLPDSTSSCRRSNRVHAGPSRDKSNSGTSRAVLLDPQPGEQSPTFLRPGQLHAADRAPACQVVVVDARLIVLRARRPLCTRPERAHAFHLRPCSCSRTERRRAPPLYSADRPPTRRRGRARDDSCPRDDECGLARIGTSPAIRPHSPASRVLVLIVLHLERRAWSIVSAQRAFRNIALFSL